MDMSGTVSTRTAKVMQWAAIFTFMTIALGSMVCATDSSSACPAWPVCYADRVGPDLKAGWLENPAIEFVHRAISFTALVLLAWSGWLGRRQADVRLRVYPWVALGFAIGSAVFGMMLILFSLPLFLGLIDVGGAIVAMTLITIAAEAASGRGVVRDAPRVRRPALAAFWVLVTMHLLGIIVAGKTTAGTGSFTRCLSWPLWQLVGIDQSAPLQVVRMVLAGAALALMAIAIVRSLRRPEVRTPAVVLGALVLLELGLGLVIQTQGLGAGQTNGINNTLAIAYSVTAVSVLWALGYVLGRAWPAPAPTPAPHPVADEVAA